MRTQEEIKELFDLVTEKKHILWAAYDADSLSDEDKNKIDSIDSVYNALAWVIGLDQGSKEQIQIEMRWDDINLEDIDKEYRSYGSCNEVELF